MVKTILSPMVTKRNFPLPKQGERVYAELFDAESGLCLKGELGASGVYSISIPITEGMPPQSFSSAGFEPIILNQGGAEEIKTIGDSLVEISSDGDQFILTPGYIYDVEFRLFATALSEILDDSVVSNLIYSLGDNATGLPVAGVSLGSAALGLSRPAGNNELQYNRSVGNTFSCKGVLRVEDNPLELTPIFSTEGAGAGPNLDNGWVFDGTRSFVSVKMLGSV